MYNHHHYPGHLHCPPLPNKPANVSESGPLPTPTPWQPLFCSFVYLDLPALDIPHTWNHSVRGLFCLPPLRVTCSGSPTLWVRIRVCSFLWLRNILLCRLLFWNSSTCVSFSFSNFKYFNDKYYPFTNISVRKLKSYKRSLKEYTSTKPALQEMLKGLL